jgi:hypothetical protein
VAHANRQADDQRSNRARQQSIRQDDLLHVTNPPAKPQG